MDDFIVDTTLRNNSKTSWSLNNKQYSGQYTSCCKESYFLREVFSVLHSLKNGLDVYILPKRSDYVLLYADADLTVVEGIGGVFLPNDESTLKVWMFCDKETEIKRRVGRDKALSEAQIRKRYEERNGQFLANIEPYKKDFDLVFDTSV